MPTLSIVVPAFNEEEGIQNFLAELKNCLKSVDYTLEVIVVNDGSTDKTRERVLEFDWDAVTIVNLMSNSGHMSALEAGLKNSSGDLIVTMDSDLQHPPQTILKMLNVVDQTNCDVVLAIRNRGGESKVRGFCSRSFYRFLSRVTDIEFANDAGDFRLMKKRVVDIILSLPENQKIFRFLVGALRFKSEKIFFDSPHRQYGKSKYQWKNLMKLAVSSLIGFSTTPLTAIFIGGIITFTLGIVYLIFVLFNYRNSDAAQGWTSLMAALISFSSIQIIALGVIGRYVSQILTEIRKRPGFIVDNIQGAKDRYGSE